MRLLLHNSALSDSLPTLVQDVLDSGLLLLELTRHARVNRHLPTVHLAHDRAVTIEL